MASGELASRTCKNGNNLGTWEESIKPITNGIPKVKLEHGKALAVWIQS